MKTLKVIVRRFKSKKTGVEFTKITAKGKFLPLVEANQEETYQIKFTSKSTAVEPIKEGIYSIACEDNKIWIDSRPEYADKNLVRVEALRTMFEMHLPRFDKLEEE